MKWLMLFLAFLFVGCCSRQYKDMFVIKNVYVDEFNITSEYWFEAGSTAGMSVTKDYYFVDKAGLYKKGDTIFISSLRKEKNEIK